jgi:hypothetical protein
VPALVSLESALSEGTGEARPEELTFECGIERVGEEGPLERETLLIKWELANELFRPNRIKGEFGSDTSTSAERSEASMEFRLKLEPPPLPPTPLPPLPLAPPIPLRPPPLMAESELLLELVEVTKAPPVLTVRKLSRA